MIRKKFPSRKEIYNNKKKKYEAQNIDYLLEQISELKNDNQIRMYALSLNIHDLYVLAYQFNDLEPTYYYEKVIKILSERINKKLIDIMWRNFSQDLNNNTHIIEFFRKTTEKFDYDKYTNPPYSLFGEIFSNEPFTWLEKYIHNSEFRFKEDMNKLKIHIESDLGKNLTLRSFTLSDKKIFEREDNKQLKEIFSNINSKNLIKIAENYLLTFAIQEFEIEMMYYIKERIGDPTEEYSVRWKNFDETAFKKAKKWFITSELEKFFDNIEESEEEARRRFSYWLKYTDYIERAKCILEQLQLFLIFDNFVVIEFGKKGNAAYIYERNRFERDFAQYMNEKNAVKNRVLKDTFKHIKRIIHGGNWESSTDQLLKNLL